MNSLNTSIILAIVGGVLILAVASTATLIARQAQRTKQTERYRQRWQEAQRYCAKPDLWPMAIIEADKLLDEVLKFRGYKGKTMGERLVAAQRQLSDNDGAWFGHKLRNKIVHEEIKRLYKKDVQSGLKGLRQAMQDLGVL